MGAWTGKSPPTAMYLPPQPHTQGGGSLLGLCLSFPVSVKPITVQTPEQTPPISPLTGFAGPTMRLLLGKDIVLDPGAF